MNDSVQDPEDGPESAAAPVKPASKRGAGKGAPPPKEDTLGALAEERVPREKKRKSKAASAKPAPAKVAAKERTEPMNFRVTADFRRAFKRAAAEQDCKKVELLERIFTEWAARNPA